MPSLFSIRAWPTNPDTRLLTDLLSGLVGAGNSHHHHRRRDLHTVTTSAAAAAAAPLYVDQLAPLLQVYLNSRFPLLIIITPHKTTVVSAPDLAASANVDGTLVCGSALLFDEKF